MDHSIQAYIKRCSSQDLLLFLEVCMQKNQWEYHAHIIPDIFLTLNSRNVTILEEILFSWNSYLQLNKKE